MTRKQKNGERSEDLSNKYLGIDTGKLQSSGGFFTAKEISQQPSLWQKTWALINDQQAQIKEFLNDAFSTKGLEIILTGAGTSAYIGNILQGTFQQNTERNTHAVATTDLVSHPTQYFRAKSPLLLISFARSGNSPESITAVNLANSCCEKVFHLIITCNPHGKLATVVKDKSTYVFLLPEEANDQSLAMTGSFTSMLLSGLLISRISEIKELQKQVDQLSKYGNYILDHYAANLQEASLLDFKRAVFLGSGPLKGSARESQLKLQELTDGKVICKYDSFLGLRHGPMAVIDNSTLLVFLFSANGYVHQYEVDLLNAINKHEKGLFRIGIIQQKDEDLDVDLSIKLQQDDTELLEDVFMAVCSVLPAQILGFYKSLNLGLSPDSPSVNGAISRVVQGVEIYNFPNNKKEAEA